MKHLKDFDINNKRVIVRADFENNDFKIRKIIPTIRYLIENRAKIVLINGNALIAKRLSQLLDQEVKFIKNIRLLNKFDVVMMEIKEDETNIKQLAESCDLFINDCFSLNHLELNSIVNFPKYIDSCAGLLLEQELNAMDSVLKEPRRPLIAILGGAKTESKIPTLIKLLDHADHVLVGGVLAPVILHSKKISLSYVEVDPDIESMLSDLELTNPKLHMPVDALVGLKDMREDYLRQSGAGKIRSEEQMFDIGPETVRMFSDIIATAGTIVWVGPMGYIEDERFSNGTLSIASAVLRSKALKIVGGSNTSSFLAKNNLRGKFNHVSTGGTAVLKYLVDQDLPGIKALS